jgi:hypothetical protein
MDCLCTTSEFDLSDKKNGECTKRYIVHVDKNECQKCLLLLRIIFVNQNTCEDVQ